MGTPNGEWWDQQKFEDCYGGTDEWDAAKDKDYNEWNAVMKPWRHAWHGKTCQEIGTRHEIYPNAELELLTVKGGPECDWERDELERIRESFKEKNINIRITHCADLNELFEKVAGNKKRSWSIM